MTLLVFESMASFMAIFQQLVELNGQKQKYQIHERYEKDLVTSLE